MRITDKYVFFWRDSIAQWHMAPIFDPVSGLMFNCAEQYMMYYKAKLFGDEHAMREILNAKHPRDQQDWGRKVIGYDQEVWNNNKRSIVFNGNFLKFTQTPHLLKELLSHKGKQFVEASPNDKIWGIGMREDDPGVDDERNWKGENNLGQVITEVRDTIVTMFADNSLYHIDGVHDLMKFYDSN